MSDGALSQDEIDALLAGVDSSSFGVPSQPSSGIGSREQEAVQAFLAETVETQSSNLSMLSGESLALSGPQVESLNREGVLQKIPDLVVAVSANFTGSIVGEHMYIMADSTGKQLASMMNKEDDIELDDMALSVISEIGSQLVGSTITAFSNKTGEKNLASDSPQAQAVPKAVVALPAGDFLVATWQLNMGERGEAMIWEVFGPEVSKSMARNLGAGGEEEIGLDDIMGTASPSMGMPGMGAPAMGGMPGMGMPGMGMPGMGMPGVQANNVQSVQFPNLMPYQGGGEQGNINLIMDVFMEISVELGRTRMPIKEILSMGEGTIIELDKLSGEQVDILVNHKLIAKGEVVIIDENFGVRVTSIVSPLERMSDMR